MEFVILINLRRMALSGACVLLLAGCGGDEAEPAANASAATPAGDSAAPAPTAAAAPQAVPSTPAEAPAADARTPQAVARDSAMTEAILKAPVKGPVNVETIESYRLTMDGVRKLVRAGQSLGELQARRPELRDSMRLEAFDPNAIYEKLNGIPEVRAAIAEVGMTPREYATATAALMQAAMVRQMRAQGMSPPVQVNEANVEFVDENWDEIQQLLQSVAMQARPRS
jgi:hypothetical protein